MLKIVTDGSADMPVGWEKEYDIHIVPIPMMVGGQSYLQGVDINFEQFYQLINDHAGIPKTSLPSPNQFMKTYQTVAEPGDTILSLHVSSKLSGTFASALTAARELAGEYQIYPFDSGSGSAMLAFMCREARCMDRSGATIQEIIQRLETIRKNVTIVFTLDSLEFARMSGRVSALTATLTSMFQIKPIIVLRDGMLDMAGKVRTRSRALDRVLEMVKQRLGDQRSNFAIVHAIDPVTARNLMERVCQLFKVKDIIMTDLSISVASNLGPRTIGIAAYPVEEG